MLSGFQQCLNPILCTLYTYINGVLQTTIVSSDFILRRTMCGCARGTGSLARCPALMERLLMQANASRDWTGTPVRHRTACGLEEARRCRNGGINCVISLAVLVCREGRGQRWRHMKIQPLAARTQPSNQAVASSFSNGMDATDEDYICSNYLRPKQQ